MAKFIHFSLYLTSHPSLSVFDYSLDLQIIMLWRGLSYCN